MPLYDSQLVLLAKTVQPVSVFVHSKQIKAQFKWKHSDSMGEVGRDCVIQNVRTECDVYKFPLKNS